MEYDYLFHPSVILIKIFSVIWSLKKYFFINRKNAMLFESISLITNIKEWNQRVSVSVFHRMLTNDMSAQMIIYEILR